MEKENLQELIRKLNVQHVYKTGCYLTNFQISLIKQAWNSGKKYQKQIARLPKTASNKWDTK